MTEIKIQDDERFKAANGQLICELIGGSHLYGLSTPASDIDYRGLFIARHPHELARLTHAPLESFVQNEEEHGRDASYYELAHFMRILAKTNTQAMEILFAPQSSFLLMTPLYMKIQHKRLELIDSERLKKSLYAYVLSETRLATGERTGRLGGKRKAAVEANGFSQKNFVQIFRLIYVGKEFFENGIYPINLKSYNPDFCLELLDIKTNPQNYSKDNLVKRVNSELDELQKIMDNSSVHHEFDWDLAAQLVLEAKYGHLRH